MIVMSLQPIMSDSSFQPWQILYKEHTYFGMKKESGKQKESTSTISAAILKEYRSTWPKEQ